MSSNAAPRTEVDSFYISGEQAHVDQACDVLNEQGFLLEKADRPSKVEGQAKVRIQVQGAQTAKFMTNLLTMHDVPEVEVKPVIALAVSA